MWISGKVLGESENFKNFTKTMINPGFLTEFFS